MSSFVSNNAILVAVICGLIAVIYGVLLIRWLLKLPAGDEVMQRIAGAVQEGAKAYLARQYRTIAIVGVVVFFVLLVALGLGKDWTYGWHAAVGFRRRASLSAAAISSGAATIDSVTTITSKSAVERASSPSRAASANSTKANSPPPASATARRHAVELSCRATRAAMNVAAVLTAM